MNYRLFDQLSMARGPNQVLTPHKSTSKTCDACDPLVLLCNHHFKILQHHRITIRIAHTYDECDPFVIITPRCYKSKPIAYVVCVRVCVCVRSGGDDAMML